MADLFMSDTAALGTLMALGAAFVLFVVILVLAIYVYFAIALMAIAKKTNTEPAWLAWIPIANVYLMIKIAGLEWWWIFGLLLPIVPILGTLAELVWTVYIWWKISMKRGYPGWWGILMLIPVVNLIMVGIIAWKEPSGVMEPVKET